MLIIAIIIALLAGAFFGVLCGPMIINSIENDRTVMLNKKNRRELFFETGNADYLR